MKRKLNTSDRDEMVRLIDDIRNVADGVYRNIGPDSFDRSAATYFAAILERRAKELREEILEAKTEEI